MCWRKNELQLQFSDILSNEHYERTTAHDRKYIIDISYTYRDNI